MKTKLPSLKLYKETEKPIYTTRELSQRYNQVKRASMVKKIGIIIKKRVKKWKKCVKYLKKLSKEKGKKVYILYIGTITESKLKNFDIEAFVIIGEIPPRIPGIPLITPIEYENILLEKEWIPTIDINIVY